MATRKQKNSRLTMGMLTDWLEDQYQLDLLNGISDLARERDVNLLCFEGGSINSRFEYEARRNVIYDFVSPENVDGLIILSALIGHFSDSASVIRFCRQYQPLPMVVIGRHIPNTPSVWVDNVSGTRELIAHLIEVHKLMRFAFIKGPVSSQGSLQRYNTFLKVLSEYGITPDQDLVVQGDYTSLSGANAIRVLLDERKANFDAVIACNDHMAFGALNELKARKISTPGEVAVAGFDNLELCTYSTPSLTTVGYSIYDLGRRAAEILMDLLESKKTSFKETIPTKLILRESCGCSGDIATRLISPGFAGQGSGGTKPAADNQKFITSTVIEKTGHLFYDRSKRIDRDGIIRKVLDAFFQEFSGEKKGLFHQTLSDSIDYTVETTSNILIWQRVISELRLHLLDCLPDKETLLAMEDLLLPARVIISQKALAVEIFRHNESVRIQRELNSLREELLAVLDEKSLMNILADKLPRLGLKGCYLVMLDDKKLKKSRLIMAYNKQMRLSFENGIVFPSSRLLPDNILSGNNQFTMLVVALNYTKPQLGFILFEISPPSEQFYGELRRILCSALQASILYKQIQEQAASLQAQKKKLSRNLSRLKKVMRGFFKAMALAAETRDPYTAGHQNRVGRLARAIAVEMRLPRDSIESINMASIIHDLGKIYIPTEILNKPQRLKELEYDLIKRHPSVAYQILSSIDFPWPIAQIVLQHHERLDGSGYPCGLTGKDIKLEAKILGVADVVDAMTSDRPYRPSLSVEQALDEIYRNRGTLYDEEVVDTCIFLFRNKAFRFKKTHNGY